MLLTKVNRVRMVNVDAKELLYLSSVLIRSLEYFAVRNRLQGCFAPMLPKVKAPNINKLIGMENY